MAQGEGKRFSRDTGDRRVNETIFLLEEEGFVFEQAVSSGSIVSYILMNDKARSAAIILTSIRGYPQTTMAKFTFSEPQLFLGPYHDTAALPEPVSVAKYLEDRSADAVAQRLLAERLVKIRKTADIRDPLVRHAVTLMQKGGYIIDAFETKDEIVSIRMRKGGGASGLGERATLRISNDCYPQGELTGPEIVWGNGQKTSVREFIRHVQFANAPRPSQGPA